MAEKIQLTMLIVWVLAWAYIGHVESDFHGTIIKALILFCFFSCGAGVIGLAFYRIWF